MITFFICLVVLIVGFFFYSRLTQKVFCIDDRKTPAISNPDGVDTTPLSTFKATLIETLNIAGTGPIFGAISGALFGPIVFIWITFGCLLGGAVHDYLIGMISSRNNGNSIVFLAGKYIGKVLKIIMLLFSLILLILVTAVFVVSPSSLLSSLTNGNVAPFVFMIIILLYYLIATILPIDKLIGKAYPVFGILLVVMALALIIGIIFQQNKFPLLELVGNLKDFSVENGGLPAWPFMFTTVACGAVSGFHATQAPMVSKCIKSEKEGRIVFYGAMVLEGIIALIWAAAAIAFYQTDSLDGYVDLISFGGGNSSTVYVMSRAILGPIGSILAIIGVVICPITSGDTALRSARLILGEIFKLDQKKIKNRLILVLPLFAIIIGISIWNFLDMKNFNLLWQWFAWSNQVLAGIALIVASIYLAKCSKYRFAPLLSGIPACFMITVVITYILVEPNIALGIFIPYYVGVIIGICLFFILLINLLFFVIFIRPKTLNNSRKNELPLDS